MDEKKKIGIQMIIGMVERKGGVFLEMSLFSEASECRQLSTESSKREREKKTAAAVIVEISRKKSNPLTFWLPAGTLPKRTHTEQPAQCIQF